jgi:hypothetical protein
MTTIGLKDATARLRELGLMDPTHTPNLQFPTAPRLPTLEGTRVALLDNKKGTADRLLKRVGELLVDRYDVAATDHVVKLIYSRRADTDLIDQLASNYDAVVTAVGD